jgi:hypothetical protein
MKKALLGIAIATALTGCGMLNKNTQTGMTPPSDTTTAVKDQRVATDFQDQGVKIYYTLLGDLDRIEVTGVAPAWKGNYAIVAELDAKEKLIKFINGESVTTERRVKIIGKALEKAQDNTLNKFKTADGTINFTEAELGQDAGGTSDNTSRRVAERVDNTVVTAVTTITAKGRLTGVRKIREGVRDDGRFYTATFQWSEKDQSTAEFIRNRMK